MFLFILEKYTTILKFSKYDHQLPWRTTTIVAHDRYKSNRRALRRFGQPPRGLRAGSPAAVGHVS
jgi:hypothetical protein